jgi:hypothetical protein
MIDRVMLDIETLALEPGASLLSVGCVRFGRQGVSETFYRSISRESCASAGLVEDEGTLEWWDDQPAEAREVLEGGMQLEVALGDLQEFVRGADEVWAKPPKFDCAHLEFAYDVIGLDTPWRHWETADARTLLKVVSESPGLSVPTVEQHGVKHHALDDARYQARQVVAALREVAGDE